VGIVNSKESGTTGRKNFFLASLPASEYDSLSAHFEQILLPRSTTLYLAGDHVQSVYFPLTSLICSIGSTQNGEHTEVSIVGGEGMVGLSAFFGTMRESHVTVCQITGEALRLPALPFQKLCYSRPILRNRMLCYAHIRLNQITQTAICNRFHDLEARLCRWLLLVHDRLQSDQLPFTQEFLSMMIGSRRAALGLVAGTLQEAGLIRYHRGEITILNRQGLEDSACECYRIMRNELNHFLDC
jgi:CRP-like cAMP-binding protein